MQIYGVVGFAGSGKDTAADFLVVEHGFHRFSFASAVKDVCSSVFGWDRVMMEGVDPESRKWRETVDVWWADKLGIPEFTPRYAMQHIGTDVFRNNFNDRVWIHSLERKIIDSGHDKVVITDCRFPNEIGLVETLGGEMISVWRGELPEWYSDAINANKGDLGAAQVMRDNGVHPSEWAWLRHYDEWDHVIDNNSDIGHLQIEVRGIVKGR